MLFAHSLQCLEEDFSIFRKDQLSVFAGGKPVRDHLCCCTSVNLCAHVIMLFCLLQTQSGRNVRFVQEQTGRDLWTACPGSLVKTLVESEMVEVTNCDKWRIRYLGTLLQQKQELHYQGWDHSHLGELIDSLCVN